MAQRVQGGFEPAPLACILKRRALLGGASLLDVTLPLFSLSLSLFLSFVRALARRSHRVLLPASHSCLGFPAALNCRRRLGWLFWRTPGPGVAATRVCRALFLSFAQIFARLTQTTGKNNLLIYVLSHFQCYEWFAENVIMYRAHSLAALSLSTPSWLH